MNAEQGKCRYCGGAKRFQIVSPVSDHAWADCFCTRQITALQDALKPFAAYDDGRAPFNLPITQGSGMARRQLTIGDCRNAKQALEKSYGKGNDELQGDAT